MKYFTVSYPDGTKHSWAYTLDEERVKLSGAGRELKIGQSIEFISGLWTRITKKQYEIAQLTQDL